MMSSEIVPCACVSKPEEIVKSPSGSGAGDQRTDLAKRQSVIDTIFKQRLFGSAGAKIMIMLPGFEWTNPLDVPESNSVQLLVLNDPVKMGQAHRDTKFFPITGID